MKSVLIAFHKACLIIMPCKVRMCLVSLTQQSNVIRCKLHHIILHSISELEMIFMNEVHCDNLNQYFFFHYIIRVFTL